MTKHYVHAAKCSATNRSVTTHNPTSRHSPVCEMHPLNRQLALLYLDTVGGKMIRKAAAAPSKTSPGEMTSLGGNVADISAVRFRYEDDIDDESALPPGFIGELAN